MKVTDQRGVRGEQERESARRERQARREHAALVGHEPSTDTIMQPPRVVRPLPPPPRPPRRGMFVVPFLILLTVGACAVATVALLHTRPTTRLDGRVAALGAQLAATQHDLAALRAQVASSATAARVRGLNRQFLGLRKSVGGVQNAIVPLKAQIAALHACIPQLQQELTGITVHVGKHGVTRVGLSPPCQHLLG